MKKILIALTMIGFAYCSAEAQETVKNQVCRMNSKGVSCYKTKYAENFKVCKDDYRYFICGETPSYANSTRPQLNILSPRPYNNSTYSTYAVLHDNESEPNAAPVADLTAPQSQSYPTNTGFGMSSANSYEGYYTPRKNYIKVCYVGENVAEDNLNPYRGCPSPQYEGPAVNNARNINANNAAYDLPPVTGRSEGE